MRAIDFHRFDFSEFMEKAQNVAPPPLLSDIRIFKAPACDLLKLPDLWASQLQQITILFDEQDSPKGEVELDFRAATQLRCLNINAELPLRPNLRVNSKYFSKLELWQMVTLECDWELLLGQESNICSINPGKNALGSIRNLCIWNCNVRFDFCAISWMTQLQKLTLNPCHLSGSVSELSKLTNLIKFSAKYIVGSNEKKDRLVDVVHSALFAFNTLCIRCSLTYALQNYLLWRRWYSMGSAKCIWTAPNSLQHRDLSISLRMCCARTI
jgi:hypothetical protein